MNIATVILMSILTLATSNNKVPVPINDYNFTKAAGVWYEGYAENENYMKNYKCWIEEIRKTNDHDKCHQGTASVYNKRTKTREFSESEFIPQKYGLIFNYTTNPNFAKWNGCMCIYAIEYDAFTVAGNCANSSSEISVWIAFRTSRPGNCVINDAMNAAAGIGLNICNLVRSC